MKSKKTKRTVTLLVMVSAAVMSLIADTETVDGYTWTYRINGDTAEIYKGSSCAIKPKPTGLVTIPSTLGGKTVTSIGYKAFSGCSGMTLVTIPDSVTDIGDQAFSGCSYLTVMTVSDSVTNIGERAFYGCSRLTVATIGNNVKSIGDRAFYGCKILADIVIPDSVMSIGDHAFYNCSKLTSAMIGNSVTSIGRYAFRGCKALANMVIPESVISIGGKAFSNCKKLEGFVVADGNPSYKAYQGLLLTKDGKTLVAVPGSFTSVTIPDGVTSIGEGAFAHCSKLTDVVIPDSVTSIGSQAFYNCSGLKSISIPDSVVNIADDAFEGCSGLFANYGGVVEDVMFSKAQTKIGALYHVEGEEPAGTVELKFGRANRQGRVRMSASASMMVDGKVKKVTAKAIIPQLSDGKLGGTLSFKEPIGDMAFDMEADGLFALKNANYEMAGAVASVLSETLSPVIVGGAIDKLSMSFSVDVYMTDLDEGWSLLEAALPNSVPLTVVNGTRWSFDKAPTLKYAKNRETGKYELVGLGDETKPNVSGLKLTYTPKTGQFKGSFKLYATNEAITPEGRSPRLKKFTVNVIGFVVDGVGYGWATLKRPNFTWSVRVE